RSRRSAGSTCRPRARRVRVPSRSRTGRDARARRLAWARRARRHWDRWAALENPLLHTDHVVGLHGVGGLDAHRDELAVLGVAADLDAARAAARRDAAAARDR